MTSPVEQVLTARIGRLDLPPRLEAATFRAVRHVLAKCPGVLQRARPRNLAAGITYVACRVAQRDGTLGRGHAAPTQAEVVAALGGSVSGLRRVARWYARWRASPPGFRASKNTRELIHE